jgi:hypothetical protein
MAALLRQACYGEPEHAESYGRDQEPRRDDAWHGPSLRKLLRGVGVDQATRKPIPDAHSIWEVVEALPEARLEEKAPGWPWTNHLMIHGTLHHDLYHAGQIALLKRAL